MVLKSYSVATSMIILLVTVTTLVLGGLGVGYYRYDKKRQLAILHNELKVGADQLASSLVQPVWNCDDRQIEMLIEGMMNNHDIYGIVVDASGNLHMRQRDEKGNSVVVGGQFSDRGLLVEQREIYRENIPIGTVKVFVAPKFIEEGLRKRLVLILPAILIVDLILILSLYLLIWQMMLKPLKVIEQYAMMVSSGGKDKASLEGKKLNGEMESLRVSIEKMVSLLDARYAEIRNSSKELQQSEEKFRAMVEKSPIGIAIVNDLNQFVYVNEKLREMVGYSEDELLGSDFTHFLAQESKTMDPQQHLRPRQEGDVSERREILFIRKNNERGFAEVQSAIYSDKAGRTNSILQVSDITGRKRAEADREKMEAQLLQAQKMESVGRLAGGVAHDFNNMLQVIIGHADQALERAKCDEALYENIQAISTAAWRSADLTRQLLAFARKQTIAPKVLDLNDTVSGMIKMLHRLIGEDIELVFKPGPDLWPIKIDPSQVDQILANLSVNARDAITNAGKLTIETENVVFDETDDIALPEFVPGAYVLLVVSDNGRGVDKQTLEFLFEPFFTTKEVGQGTGLGLATVYGIVKQNNGFIDVYSEPGQGTTFKIYLPRTSEIAVREPESVKEKPASGSETVLLVEDDPSILNLGKTILRRFGYSILAALDPKEALALAKRYEGPIHLLVTDVVMPGMNGKDLKDRLAVEHPEMKALYMSGYTSNVILHHGVVDEGVWFLQKPFSINSLAAKVREVLDHV